ncbi:hypothetical protein Tco_0673910 [Tanacetum coccineum]
MDTLQKEEVAKQVHLDSLLAQRIAEEEELNEQQKKRKAQVQFEAQHYTNEDWDLIRAKIEANAELSKSMLGSELPAEDFAKKMVDLVNQRKKYFAEERAKAKRNKPMTQSQLKTYMMNYLKNQGTWKLSQLKNLSFEEVKKEFDKLVKQVESFALISFEATKASLKRFGEELQTKTPKRLKDHEDHEAKDDESTKKFGKRRKQMARRGLHTSIDKDDSEPEVMSKTMLKMKLLDGKMNEDCYKMLKMMEKQAEGDILEELLNNDSLSLPKNESFHFDRYYDPSSPRPPTKPPDDDDGIYFDAEPDTKILTIKVVDDIFERYVLKPIILPTQPTLFLCPVIDTLLPFSFENEDKVFNPGILASKEEKSPHLLSHRGFKAFQLISDFSESPMMIYGGNIPILDVPIALDYEDSRARGFVLRSLELQSLA